MKDAHGTYLQGYNAQNAVAKDRTNLASEVVNDQNDSAQWHPMTGRTSQNLTDAGCGQAVGLWLGDAGYCNQETLAGIGPDGPKVLLATRKEHKARQPTHAPANDGPPPDGLSLKEKMDWELNTTAGKAAYRQRAATVEPGFGHHKHNRGMLRFLRAGLSAADSEWKMINATGNIQKLYRRVLCGKATANWSTLSQLISISPAA